jgi:serine/threonine protein kinase
MATRCSSLPRQPTPHASPNFLPFSATGAAFAFPTTPWQATSYAPAQRSSAARREVSVPTARLGFSGGLYASDLEAHRGQMTARVRHDSLSTPRVYTQSLPSARERGHTPLRRPPLAPTPLSSSASSFQAMTVGSSVSTADPSTPMALSPLLTSRLNGAAPPAVPWVPPSAVAFAAPVAMPFSNSLSSPCLTAFNNENRPHQVPSSAVHRSRSFTPDLSAFQTNHWPHATPRVSPQATVSWIPPPVAAHPSSARSPRVQVQRESSIPMHIAPLRDFCLQQHSFTPVVTWQAEHARAVSCTPTVRGPTVASFTPPLCISAEPVATEAASNNDADPEKYVSGSEVSIGPYRFRCTSVLGRGSFSEVWAGEVLGSSSGQQVALKDIVCRTNTELQQALLEVQLLERFRVQATAIREVSPSMRIPQYFSHRVDKRGDSWRVRLAMARVPGESLDSWYRRQALSGQDGPSSVRRGCALAIALIRQLAPTLEQVAPYAFHRDINSHNVLVSDNIDGGRLDCCSDIEELSRRASFWLIDFGLAVDAKTWPQKWTHSDVAGDCRYWPPSSFIMSFCGPEETRMKQDFCTQYKTKLDVVGLGLTALEMLCSTALSSRSSWGKDGLRGSWQRLFEAWERYREDVTRWHTMIFQVFTSGGDINPLYQQLGKERVVDRVIAHTVQVRECLKACIKRTEDRSIQSLLLVLSEMIDERSKFGFAEVLECLNSSMKIEAPADAHALPPPPTRMPRSVVRELPMAPSEPVALPVHRRQATSCQRKSREDFNNDQRLNWFATGGLNSAGVQVKTAFGSTNAWTASHIYAAGA